MDERVRFIGSTLRFAPIEVVMRYYGQPLVSTPSPDTQSRIGSAAINGGATAVPKAYANLRHARPLKHADQAYEHPLIKRTSTFDQAYDTLTLLYCSQTSPGFTKLTNQLLDERGDEGAEILNNISAVTSKISSRLLRGTAATSFCGRCRALHWSSSVADEPLSMLTLRATACAMGSRAARLGHGRGDRLRLHLGLGAGRVRGSTSAITCAASTSWRESRSGSSRRQSSGYRRPVRRVTAGVGYLDGSCYGTLLPPSDEFGAGFHAIHRCHCPPELMRTGEVCRDGTLRRVEPRLAAYTCMRQAYALTCLRQGARRGVDSR